jgi:hypothetical protein
MNEHQARHAPTEFSLLRTGDDAFAGMLAVRFVPKPTASARAVVESSHMNRLRNDLASSCRKIHRRQLGPKRGEPASRQKPEVFHWFFNERIRDESLWSRQAILTQKPRPFELPL